ncbi:MAG: ribosomal protein S18-alanine N-acetyltransferase [Burkholderiales bacterium]|nr:ribosomal protein S18-alanine N-acetyltransferase [Burkholderiales bacterium]
MTVADLGAVMALEVQAYSHPWSQGNFVDSLAAGHLTEVLVSDAPAGPVIGYFVAMEGVQELHLLNLTIAPAWQGRGHGSALLDAVLAHAEARRLPTVWLEVRASNVRARALYARRGFDEAGLRRGYYPAARGREDAVVMRRVLAPAASAQRVASSAAGATAGATAGGPDALE